MFQCDFAGFYLEICLLKTNNY